MTSDSQIISALRWSGVELHPRDRTQRPVSCQVPAVYMRVSKLWGERKELDLQNKQNQTNVYFSKKKMLCECRVLYGFVKLC